MNCIVLITGVSRHEGIGYGLATRMAELGFQVVIAARDLAKSSDLAGRIKGRVTPAQVDITDEESVKRLASFIETTFGRLDVLINNAGGVLDYGATALRSDFEVTRKAFDTNLFGTWRMIQRMHPLLKKSGGGRVVNVSSAAGSFTHPVFGLGRHPASVASYGLSKLALNGLTASMAPELKSDNILINAVNPGLVATAPGMEKMGARSVSDSIGGIIWAASLPDDGPTGKFFEDGQELAW